MQIVYTPIKHLPASLLFYRCRSLASGFRWAPASLLGKNRNYVFRGRQFAPRPKVITDKDVELNKSMMEYNTPALVINPKDTTESALVSVTEEQEGAIHAMFLRKAYVRKRRMAGLTFEIHRDWRRQLIETREVSSAQCCCIR